MYISLYFQFPLWDTVPILKQLMSFELGFQFPLWDTYSKNTRYIVLCDFQFPLWDTRHLDLVLHLCNNTFNSLYGILRKKALQYLEKQYLFQFPLWDTINRIERLNTGFIDDFQFPLWDTQ